MTPRPGCAGPGRARRLTAVLAGGLALLGACAPAGAAPLNVTVHGPDDRPLADAVVAVFVEGAPRLAGSPVPVEMGQRDKRFVPGLLAVQTGTPVSFPNFDTVRHHVYSFSPAKTFEIKLYVGTPVEPVVFDKAGTAVLGCNIHDTMAAFVRVVDTPFFGRSDALGQVRLDVPAGSHRVQVWHASLPLEADPPLRALRLPAGGSTVTLSLAVP